MTAIFLLTQTNSGFKPSPSAWAFYPDGEFHGVPVYLYDSNNEFFEMYSEPFTTKSIYVEMNSPLRHDCGALWHEWAHINLETNWEGLVILCAKYNELVYGCDKA